MTNQITDVANFFSTTLTADVGAGSDTFPVDSIGDLTSPCFITINPDDPLKREVILCDGTFGASSFVTSDRSDPAKGALEGSATPGVPLDHLTGDPVSVTPLAQHIDDLNDRIGAHTHTSGDDGAVVTHANLSLLTADDHTLYIRKDGARAFTGEVAGITPTASASLATKDYVDARMPTGSMTMYGGSAAPSGWLLTDGSSVSTTTYAALFAVVGYTFGGSGGSFNLPDMRAKFPVGAQAGGDYDLGDTGGAASVTLTSSQMPSHTHTGPNHSHSGPSHTHSVNPPNTTTSSNNHNHDARYRTMDSGTGPVSLDIGVPYAETAGTDSVQNGTATDSSHTHTVDIDPFTSGAGGTGSTGNAGTGATGSAGSGSSHENRPPFLALNFIIKT